MRFKQFLQQRQGIPFVLTGIIILIQVPRCHKKMLHAGLFFRRWSGCADGYIAIYLTTVAVEDRAAVVLRYA